MDAKYRTQGGILFEIEAASPKEMFKKIALVQEIFDSDGHCGNCQSANIRFSVRTVDENEFYEMRCRDCFAQLNFGQHKKGGGLFVKRKDEDGHPLGKNGWYIYKSDKKEEPAREDARNQRRDEVDESDIPF